MRPEPEDRLSQPSSRTGVNIRLLIAAVILVVIAVIWFTGGEEEEAAPPEPATPAALQEPAPEPERELPPAPDIPPVPEPKAEPEVVAAPTEAEPVTPVPPSLSLEESDPVLREAMAAVGDSALIDEVLAQDNLVERGAGLIDASSRGLVMRKLIPVAPPREPFSIMERNGQTYMDPAGYRRYDSYAGAIAGLDTALLADNFHRFRPLLEEAYAALGYPADEMDNALVRALDRVLATPEINEPISVEKVEAVYKYVDPSLEKLPAIQKQLLRMGPDNIAKIKRQARALRRALLQGGV